jgi:cyclomaltodextrinase
MIHIPGWVRDAIFYQIFPDRFARSERLAGNASVFETWDSPPNHYGFKGGYLYGAAEKLDYLHELGVTAIYLNPIFESAANHRYHTYDYYQVDPLLGGNAALKHLLDKAHARSMRVILDGVFNHASRGFWQFHHVLETGAASPYKDWFHFDPDRLRGEKRWGAYPTLEEMHAIQNEGTFKAIGYQGWWNLPALPKFNTATPAVREFLFGVAEHWIRFGADGWRLDVPGEIDDDSFWREFRNRVRAVNPDAYIVGEIWHEAQRWLQGDQFDAVMNYPLTAAALSFCGGPHLDMNMINRAGGLQGRVRRMDAHEFGRELERLYHLYPQPIPHAQFNLLDSHDMPRFLSCVSHDKAALKLAWLLLLTFPGAPCIYYGDEIGMDGGTDPECRKSFPWNDSDWDRDLFTFIKACIKLRSSQPALRHGEFQTVYAQDHCYGFIRSTQESRVLVVLNAGENSHPARIPSSSFPGGNFISLLGQTRAVIDAGHLALELEPRSGVVLVSQP